MKLANAYDEREFDVRELCLALYRKTKIIFMIGIISAITIFLISYYLIEWKYESTTQIYVLSTQEDISEVTYSDLEISSYLIKDFITLVTSRLVTEQVITELKLDMKPEELVQLIHVENPSETRILNITAEYKNPLVAKQIADAVRKFTSGLITTVTGHEQASQIKEANVPVKPSTPNVKRNTILGGAMGVVTSIFVILLRYISDDTIKTTEDMEKNLGIRCLCTIPIQIDKNIRKKLSIKSSKKLSEGIKE